MSKSIFQQLEDGIVDVQHVNRTISVPLPQWLCKIGGVLSQRATSEDEQMLITDILIQHDVFDGFIALALQQAIVAVRAVSRPADKPDPDKKGDLIHVAITHEYADKRAKEYKPKSLQRPKKTETPDETRACMFKEMLAEGMSPEDIIAKYVTS